ncbi:MAG: FHA domain-containing protein [Sumerlaeia bacterium]
MSASLLVDGPGMWAYNIELKKVMPLTIGRTRKNELVLQDQRVSSSHAIVFFDDGKWILEDLDSSNGTQRNGQQVKGKVQIMNGDSIRIGSTEILFKDKESHRAEETWDKTMVKMTQHEIALKAAVKRAEAASNENDVVSIPDLHIADSAEFDGNAIPVSGSDVASGPDVVSMIYENNAEKAANENQKKAEDMLWIAEHYAEVVGQLARSGGRSKTEMYTKALEYLCLTIEMQNGFLMVPNKVQKRWVIEAWTGNNEEWTSFEKNHPVPLTVANDAWKNDEIYSNVWGEHRKGNDSSASLLSLNVQTYIAVPIHKSGTKAGLIYLDQRKQLRTIADKEVYLINKLGKYIIEFELNS